MKDWDTEILEKLSEVDVINNQIDAMEAAVNAIQGWNSSGATSPSGTKKRPTYRFVNGKLEAIPQEPVTTECAHTEIKEYLGLFERFRYCVKCDHKFKESSSNE